MVLLFWCRITVLLTLIFFLYLFTLLLAFGLTVTILYSEIQMNFFVRYEFWLRFNCYSFRKINFLLSNCFTLEFYTNLPQVPGGWSRWFCCSSFHMFLISICSTLFGLVLMHLHSYYIGALISLHFPFESFCPLVLLFMIMFVKLN